MTKVESRAVAVRVEKLRKDFGAVRAVDEINFEVKPGEFFSLLGSSGCGKTTTLRCVAGLEIPDAGAIYFSGENVAKKPPELRDCGMVFQNYALFPHMTVADNVAYGLMARQYRQATPLGKLQSLWKAIFSQLSSEEKAAVEQVLASVELEGFENRKPEQLSGGQQQRVALARALVTKPKVLLFDEPLGALDAKLRVKMREEIRRIQKEAGITAIYVTHDQEEALAVSDRMAVMRDGRIEGIGTPSEIYGQPGTRFMADFLGMKNIFEVEEVESEECRLAGGVRLRLSGAPSGGEKIALVLRPDSIEFSDKESPNAFQATLRHRVFLGNTQEYVFQAAFGELRVLRPRTEKPADLTDGEAAWLRVCPRELLWVRSDGSEVTNSDP